MSPHEPEPHAGGSPDERPSATYDDPQVNRGGADAVQKTTGLGARASADPDERRDVHAAVPAGRGLGAAGWVAIVAVLVVLAFYLSGVF